MLTILGIMVTKWEHLDFGGKIPVFLGEKPRFLPSRTSVESVPGSTQNLPPSRSETSNESLQPTKLIGIDSMESQNSIAVASTVSTKDVEVGIDGLPMYLVRPDDRSTALVEEDIQQSTE
jgi:hypothetical protein